MSQRVWILGAPDPEMERIEALLRECGETIMHVIVDGRRVRPESAYRTWQDPCGSWDDPDIITVECATTTRARLRIDHHRPGDPGYGRPPAEFMTASSLGQAIAELARLGRLPAGWQAPGDLVSTDRASAAPGAIWYLGGWWFVRTLPSLGWRAIPQDLVYAAAADHCLAAAYRGECPGVSPDELMRWRVETRAAFQGRPVETILADIEATRAALREAPRLILASTTCPWHDGRDRAFGDCANARGTEWAEEPCSQIAVRDMRREPAYPELPEAAARAGAAYISGPFVGPDGRRKFTCAGPSKVIEAFLDGWAAREGLVDLYGDPARGFAGGYEP